MTPSHHVACQQDHGSGSFGSDIGPEMLKKVVELLGCSRKEHPELESKATENAKQVIVPAANGVLVKCPALSLKHEASESRSKQKRGRAQAEEHAASLLSRPLELQVELGEECCSLREEGAPELLLQNVYESFAKLVHSRLRAYSTLIARHGLSLAEKDPTAASIEEKLERLLQVAGAVYAEEMITRFQSDEATGVDLDEDDSSSGASFTLRITLDLVLPGVSGEDQIVKVGMGCPGEIRASPESKSIEIQLDAHKLLLGLVEQAAHVVDAIAEVATSAKAQVTPAMPRSASFLAMPPPKSRGPHDPHDPHEDLSYQGLELLSKAAAALPIVSPDMSGNPGCHHPVPALRLEHFSQICRKEKDVSQMSVDQCANIVDSIFGEGVDESVFHHHQEEEAGTATTKDLLPAAKRARIC